MKVTEDIEAGALVLVPLSTSLTYMESDEAVLNPRVVRTSIVHPVTGKSLHIGLQFTAPTPSEKDKGFTPPFWCVPRVCRGDAADDGNMKLIDFQFTRSLVIPSGYALSCKAAQETFVVPLLINTKMLSKGDTLLWVDPTLQKKRKDKVVVAKPTAPEKKTKVNEACIV